MEVSESRWNGFKRIDFTFDGRNAIVVFADNPVEGNKWMMKTEYFGAFPNFEIEMLKRGYHLAYVANRTRWVADDDIPAKAKFADYLTEQYNFNNRCFPVGMSCGGMQAIYLAAAYPEKVAAMYLDAPVCNLLSCPFGVGRTNTMADEFVKARQMSLSEMLNYRNHPIDHVKEIAESRVPTLLVAGDSDTVVPYDENGKVFAERVRALGGNITEIVKPGCDHHPHGFDDPQPIVDFILANY